MIPRPRTSGEGSVSGATPFVVGLGSNVGDRRSHLADGIAELGRHVEVEAVSRVVESEAWGPVEQGPFLNLVARGRTAGTASELLRAAQEAESSSGRVRRERFGPRTLDVDILFFGDLVLESSVLSVPHPRWRERPFVAALLQDVAEGMTDPRSGLRIAELVPPGPLPGELQEVSPLDAGAPRPQDGVSDDEAGPPGSGGGST